MADSIGAMLPPSVDPNNNPVDVRSVIQASKKQATIPDLHNEQPAVFKPGHATVLSQVGDTAAAVGLQHLQKADVVVAVNKKMEVKAELRFMDVSINEDCIVLIMPTLPVSLPMSTKASITIHGETYRIAWMLLRGDFTCSRSGVKWVTLSLPRVS